MKQLAWHAVFLRPIEMFCPTKLGLEEYCFSACCLDSIQDLKNGDLVLPANAKDGTKGAHMKLFKPLNMPAGQCPGLAPMEKRRKTNGTVDLELRGESDVVLVEPPSAN